MSSSLKSKASNPLLFLDVDGVLNTPNDGGLSSAMIKRLSNIIAKTKCQICLSTSWRADQSAKKSLFEALTKVGKIDIDSIYIGDTPAIYHLPRAYEIAEFLESKYDQNALQSLKWVALDDMPLDNPVHESRGEVLKKCKSLMKDHFVHTDDTVGMTDDDMKQAIALLM